MIAAGHRRMSPFAGVLSDGATHQIALSLYGADSYFSVAGALLLYLDPGATQVTGSVTTNTLAAAPSPTVTNTIQTVNGNTVGGVSIGSIRDFSIVGTAVTSSGTVQNTVNQTGSFTNAQQFKISAAKYVQSISQNTLTTVQTITTSPSGTRSTLDTYTYPLTVDLKLVYGANGGGRQEAAIGQNLQVNRVVFDGGTETNPEARNYSVNTVDTLLFNSNFNIVGHRDQASSADLAFYNDNVRCFQRHLEAVKNILTVVKTGCGKK
ncbi:MAG: peptide-N4-asparagine amidase [Rhodospirillales bacterium]